MKKYVNIFLILLLLLIAHPAHADGHGKAVMGTILGGVLIGIGATSLATDTAECPTPNPVACAKIALDVLEIVGGAMAMSQNSQAAAQTAPTGGINGIPKLNLPPGTLPPDIKIPKPGIVYFTKNPDGTFKVHSESTNVTTQIATVCPTKKNETIKTCVALTFNQDQTAVISTKNVTFVDSLGAGLDVVSISDLALPAAPTQPDSLENTTEQALISLLMTLSDA